MISSCQHQTSTRFIHEARVGVNLCRNDPQTADGIGDAIDQLAVVGPALGRPLVDRVHGSRHHNMKELRPPSSGRTEVRLLFAFDPEREAILLVAGDKSGQWETWYRRAIPLADRRFDEHLQTLKDAAHNDRDGKEEP